MGKEAELIAAARRARHSRGARPDRLEAECEQLRALGEAFVRRRFGAKLSAEDAEDVVAEVILRFHRRYAQGEPPHNLRAAFLTSVRNAAIDLLRYRGLRPSAPLEAADASIDEAPPPAEQAEQRERTERVQEALGRMRANHREAILLRFGLGMTVPEIAARKGLSLPAAKKLVLRATRQAGKQLLAIEGAEFCPEIRALGARSLLDREGDGLPAAAEAELLRSHLAHCGSCRAHLVGLRRSLHDLGAAVLLGLGAADPSRPRLLDAIAPPLAEAGHALEAVSEKARQFAARAAGLPGGEGVGALLGTTGQKLAAVCGTATAATCLMTGAVGPGVGASSLATEPERVLRSDSAPPGPAAHPESPAAVPPAPPPVTPAPAPPQKPDPRPPAEPTGPTAPAPPTVSPAPSEFGLESAAAGGGAPPSTQPPPSEPTGPQQGGSIADRAGESPAPAPASGTAVGFEG